MIKWLENKGSKYSDVLISTRIRIARNIKPYNFPGKIKLSEADKLTDDILNIIKNDDSSDYKFFRMRDLKKTDKLSLVENHLISPSLVKRDEISSFLLRNDEKVTIMINEEDHLRIQILSSDLDFEALWKEIDQIDNKISENLDYAFSSKYGYLSSCPTNTGTGLRISVMLHLPCLTRVGSMKNLIEGLEKINITTRGFYGEGSNKIADIYQISNQKTLGNSEEEIIEKFKKIILQIIRRERETREQLKTYRELEIEDRISRSFGILKYAKKLNITEAMIFLANLRTGWEMGLIDKLDEYELTRLIISIQPYNIKKLLEDTDNKEVIEIKRANMVKEYVEKLEG